MSTCLLHFRCGPYFVMAGVLAALSSLNAEVKVSSLFADHMVLQREMPVPVWGTAAPSERITVTAGNSTAKAIAGADGKWMVRLPAMKASSTSIELNVSGENSVTIRDVLIGDVWVCSGQSNMAFALGSASTYKKELPNADHPNLRGLFIPKKASFDPQSNCDATWKPCTADTAKGFSAVAYYFGKEIMEAENVPVGLIQTNVGGTPAQAWTSMEALQADSDLKKSYADVSKKFVSNLDAIQAAHDKWLANGGADYLAARTKYNQDSFAAQQKGEPAPQLPAPPSSPEPPRVDNPATPGVLYNGMVAPLIPFAIKGVIWYQGESNVGQFALYGKLFPAMIADWRKRWGQGDFPFLYVQLPNYGVRDVLPSPSFL